MKTQDAAHARSDSRPFNLSWLALSIPFLPQVLASAPIEMLGGLSDGLWAYAHYVTILWVVAGAAIMWIRQAGTRVADLGFRMPELRWFGWAVVATLVGFGIFMFAQWLSGLLGFPPMSNNRLYTIVDAKDWIIVVFACVLLGPLAEEMIYRGFLIQFLQTKLRSASLAYVGATLIFVGVHWLPFGPAGSLFILLWTPLCVVLFVRSGSLYPALLMHVLNNFAAYVVVPLARQGA